MYNSISLCCFVLEYIIIDCQNSKYLIDEPDINLDDYLRIDILKGNEFFDILVGNQNGNHTCGPLSVADNVGLIYALQHQTFRPVIGIQELIQCLPFQGLEYAINEKLNSKLKYSVHGHSLPFSLVDLFFFFKKKTWSSFRIQLSIKGCKQH